MSEPNRLPVPAFNSILDAPVVLPAIPQILEELFDRERADRGYLARYSADVTPAMAEAATRHLALRDALFERARLAPAFEGRVRLWCETVNAGLAWPLSAASLNVMLEAVLTACRDIPARCFNDDTLAAAMRGMERMSTKAIHAIVSVEAAAIEADRATLRAILRQSRAFTRPNPDTGPNLAAEERDAVLARFRPQIAAILPDIERVPAQPGKRQPIAPLTPEELAHSRALRRIGGAERPSASGTGQADTQPDREGAAVWRMPSPAGK